MDINFNTKRSDVLLIKVHQYEGKEISGRLFDSYSNTYHAFENMTQLILKIDEIINSDDTTSATKEDIFSSARKESRFDLVKGQKPWLTDKQRVLTTFKLQVLFRKFNTWQGTISSCTDNGKSSAFRSVLELTMMMDSELEAVKAALSTEEEGCL